MTRTALSLTLVLALAAAPAALAQHSEDDRILKDSGSRAEGTDLPPPAPTEEEELDEQVFYSGMGVSRVETDYANLGEAINLDVVLGFRIPTVKWFGIEIDIGQTIIPGEYRDPRPAQPAQPIGCGPFPNPVPCTTPAQPAEDGASDANDDEFAMQALGIAAAFKTTGRFYVMGRYGYRYIATSNDTINEKRSGNGFGVGAGYRWGKGLSGVELSYRELADKVDSIGLVFYTRFQRN